MSGFLGMRDTSDWPDGARPKNWREMILWLYPNGQASLTALLALAAKESVDDYEYSWYTQTFPDQRGSFTAGQIYTNQALTSAYASGGVAGDVLYVKTTAAVASEFRAGHEVQLRDASDLTVDVVAKCIASVQNGANSYVAVALLEDDDNSSVGDLSDADTIRIVGSISPQGGITPAAISYQPTKYHNKTQIFRTPLEIARTVMKTRNRTGNLYKNMKKLALELHSVQMEQAFWWGIVSENTGENGLPETTTEGLITFLRNNLPSQVRDFATDGTYSGATWLERGDDFLLDSYELLTRFTDQGGLSNYMQFAGSGALKHIERLARQNGQFNIEPAQKLGYGFEVRNLVNSFGVFPIMTHPLFSRDATTRDTLAILKPKNIRYRYIDDTQFYGASGKPYAYTSSGKRIDGLNEEFLTECGLEYHHPQTAMYLTGFGSDNTA